MKSVGQDCYLQLTILSVEIWKKSLRHELEVTLSCSASELPKFNCIIQFSSNENDIGPKGFLVRDKNRPLITGDINIGQKNFNAFCEASKTVPPRNASIFLITSPLKDFLNPEINKQISNPRVNVLDCGWRFPLI
jgi:hypothetical protein